MKELKEFPGYFVTEDGRVFSAWKLKFGKGIKGIIKYTDPYNLKELNLHVNSGGYFVVALYADEKRYTKSVHRLVAETYIENIDNLPCVNHIDENKSNNHISNLEWVTNHENIIHSWCRWIWKIENIITGEIAETINLREFARDNNLHPSHLHQTLNGRLKKHKNFRIISKTQFK